MDDRLKIGFFCAHDPYDRRSFSGTPSYMLDALGRRDDIVLRVLGPYRRGYRGKLLSAWRRWRKTPLRGPEAGAVKGLDWVIVPVSSRFIPERRGAAGPKFVHVTDATPQFLRDFYARPTSRQADLVEQTALERADLVVYSSGYMAGRALAEFGGADAAKIHAISFGLNLDALPPPPGAKPPPDPLKLIFIGKNWQTKGGIIAAEANEILNRRGIASELTVIGGRPDDPSRYGNARFLGYLDKGRAKDYRLLTRSLSQAHLFVLPTQADCTPMVVAEANAHGVPAVIRQAGGGTPIRRAANRNRSGAGLPRSTWLAVKTSALKNAVRPRISSVLFTRGLLEEVATQTGRSRASIMRANPGVGRSSVSKRDSRRLR